MGCDLSILCVSKVESEVIDLLAKLHDTSVDLGAEFTLVVDGDALTQEFVEKELGIKVAGVVKSDGYIESILDEAVSYTHGDYVLRMDDDESVAPDLFDWLTAHEYASFDNWKFPRAHLWQSDNRFIVNPPLWPDMQTRLSVRSKSGHRTGVHAGSPYGGGKLAPCAIIHHKFLVKSIESRRSIASTYDMFHVGYGTGPSMLPFSMPEEAFNGNIETADINSLSGKVYSLCQDL